MALNHSRNEIDPRLLKRMNAIPALARYIRNRGVSYAVSWVHRLTGVFMVMFLGFHIFTLSALTTPAAYAEKMKLYQLPVLVFIEWALALPVVFHALNGGRLILYESFRCRNDQRLLNWVVGLTLMYAGLLAVRMRMGSQSVSAVFFWLVAVLLAATAAAAATDGGARGLDEARSGRGRGALTDTQSTFEGYPERDPERKLRES